MTFAPRVSRRALLRGAGASLALPWLEAMRPTLARAAGPPDPLRLAVLFVPNGINMADWTPADEGADFALPAVLEPLAAHRRRLLVLTGLTHDKARANGDGPGDHARSAACFLTGCQPFKTDGAKLRAGISFDQVAAQYVGPRTRLPSLELGIEPGANAGNCDSGYSCAYSANISWSSASRPMTKVVAPRLVFERLFGDGQGAPAERAKRLAYRQSVLDHVLEDASRLEAQLGRGDRRKLDEYLTSVRDVERRLTLNEADPPADAVGVPERPPADYQEHIRLMCDLMALAFRTDTTRVCTFMLANEGSNRSYQAIGVPEGHHDLSHHGNDEAKKAKIRDINRFHTAQLAYLLDRLAQCAEGEGSLLDNALVLYGSGISDGNRHNHDDLPVLLAGGGRGTIRSGRHVRYADETPLSNLFLSLLDRFDAPIERLGDSTQRLTGLEA